MVRRRRTKAERDHVYNEAERHVWEAFRPRLAALETYAEALELVADSPPPDSPGRRYYSNLSFFLGRFVVPHGSSQEERAHYLRFIERLDAGGVLRPGAGKLVADSLRRVLKP
jgi:hypothetical protein